MERHSIPEDQSPQESLVYESERQDVPVATSTNNEEVPTPPPSVPTLSDTHEHAGFWLRLVAFTLDSVILGLFALFLLFSGVLVTAMSSGLSEFILQSEEEFSLLPLWMAGMLTGAAAYFTILHSEYGQTIGKSLLGLEVRTPDGALLNYSQALFRWLAYGVSASFFGLGFLWAALPPRKRGWHDVLAGTVVVMRKYKAQNENNPIA